MRGKIVTAFIFLTMMTGAVSAAPVLDYTGAERLEEARQREEERQERLRMPRVENMGSSLNEKEETQGAAGPVFRIDEIILSGQEEKFGWLQDIIQPHIHTDMGISSVNRLVKDLNAKLLAKGYVTSRVVVPEQNMKNGKLLLRIQTGRLHKIIYSKNSALIPWKNAFPIKEGDILNIRRLEQGLEQMKRVSSSDVSMKLLPAEEADMTDVELSITKGKQIKGSLSVDDSGLEDTGSIQWNAALGIDRLFNANDFFRISGNTDGSRDGYEKGTRGQGISYSIPRGWDTFTLRHNRYRYHRTVESNPYDFISSGKTRITEFTFSHVMGRTKNEKYGWDISLTKRNAHYFINDMEIPVQAMDTTAMEIGLFDRVYTGGGTLYTRLGYKMGTGWFGAKPDTDNPDSPKTHYKMWLLDIDWQKPLTMGHRPASFTTSLHGQWTTGGMRLYSTDMVSIGNRYTVRGFDGEYTLIGENGWYLRNELSSSLPRLHSSVYAGLDAGAVYGVSTEILTGRTIAGMALGMRGTFPSGLFYDTFISRALYKPDGFHTKTWAGGFTLGCQF